MPIFEYKCAVCGLVQEKLCPARPRPAIVPCPCGAQGTFQFSAPHLALRMGLDSALPTSAARWSRAHAEQLKKETQHG